MAILFILLSLSTVVFGFAEGYAFRGDRPAKVVELTVPGPVEYLDRVVEKRVEVPGPVEYRDHTVERIVNHYTVKRIPSRCPSVADALNEYERINR